MLAGVILGVLSLGLAFSARATDFYTAPNGYAQGRGTIDSPWDLTTALKQPSTVIKPGDTLWLRGGTYRGTFISTLAGTAGLPVTVRNYPGEWAVIDRAAPGLFPGTLQINGSWAQYWGFEVTNSDLTRTISTGGSNPVDARAQGITINGSASNVKLINLVVHDSGNGIVSNNGGSNIEIYGSLIYHNGWAGPDRAHGDGIYGQNKVGTLRVADNLLFSGFNEGINLYASDQAFLNGLIVEGNIALNSGVLGRWFERNILVGGWGPCPSPLITNNYTYFSNNSAYGPGQPLNLGYSGGCQSAVVQNNYFVSTTMFIGNTNLTITGNTFAGVVNFSGSNSPYSIIESYPGNVHIPYGTRPTGVYTFVRPNQYEPGRGHIAIFDWANLPSVNVDLSPILSPGAAYEIRDAQNFFATPLVSGTYSGGTVAIPMTSTTMVAPVGATPPYFHTNSDFGAFVVVRPGTVTPGSSGTAMVATPAISPNGGTANAPLTVSLSTVTPGASIYYTTNGNLPTTASTLYTGPFSLTSSATVMAKAVTAGMLDSPVASATFNLNQPTAAMPVISPNGGSHTGPVTVTLSSATSGASIYYTTNGTTPTIASFLYAGPFTLTSGATVIAKAVASGMTESPVASALFTIAQPAAAMPTISPNGGTTTGPVTVSLSSTTSSASIYFTTDGTAPGTASPLYTGPFTLSASATVKAKAVGSGMTDSPVASATFTIAPPPPSGTGSWYNGWQYRKAVTINAAKVAGSLTNFPVLVSITDADLQTRALVTGADILFTAADGVTKLNHEIESYNAAAGVLVAWVNLPVLNQAANTSIYLYFGNALAANQASQAAVWDSNFKAVWHLKESPAGTAPQIKDSTSNGNHGTTYGSMKLADQTDGISGSGLTFDGKVKFINVPDSASVDTSSALTVSTWMRTTSGNFNLNLVNKGSGCINSGFALWVNENGRKPGMPGFWVGSNGWVDAADLNVSDGAWHQVTATNDSTTTNVYVDGVLRAAGARTGILNTTSPLRIAYGTCGNYFGGSLDEVRISGVARSAAWIATEYANQSAPQSFAAVAALEVRP